MVMAVNIFDELVRFNKSLKKDIRKHVENFNPHLIHSHNAPNTLTLAAIDYVKDIPLIHDVHEVLSVHNSGFKEGDVEETLNRYQSEEKKANEESDARIYATEGIKNYIENSYDVESNNDLVFLNYPSKSMFPQSLPKKPRKADEINIVYIGCVTSVVEGSHYDLRNIFKHIANQRIHIHIYPTTNLITKSNKTYKKLASSNKFIHFHSHLPQNELLKEITQYDYGWVGLNSYKNGKHLDIVLPNKVMEYIACGLPVLTFHHKTIAHFIEKNSLGIVLEDVDQLANHIKNTNYSTLRENVLNRRYNFTIEKQIPKLVNFYERTITQHPNND
jgi:glycosyltransferase involved in cell wall biosynthesis